MLIVLCFVKKASRVYLLVFVGKQRNKWICKIQIIRAIYRFSGKIINKTFQKGFKLNLNLPLPSNFHNQSFINSQSQSTMSFQIQNQIKRNAQQIRTYMTDLHDWQHEMQIKQKAKNKVLKEQRAKEQEIKKQLEKEIQQKKKLSQQQEKKQEINKQAKEGQPKVDLVRDTNTIKDYYSAWDKFNVDQQITKLQEQQKRPYLPYNPYENSQNYIRAKPKAKVNISINRQRAAVIDPSELKDKGNIHFKVCEYEKAIDAYSQCLQKLSEQQPTEKTSKLRAVVLSNRAMSYMKLNENSKALRDCTQSLRHDPSYLKSYLRRGECHKKLSNYLQSLADFRKVKQLDPNDNDVATEIRKIEKYLEKLYKEARDTLVVHNAGSVVPNSYRIPVEEVEEVEGVAQGAGGLGGNSSKKETNYLEEL